MNYRSQEAISTETAKNETGSSISKRSHLHDLYCNKVLPSWYNFNSLQSGFSDNFFISQKSQSKKNPVRGHRGKNPYFKKME